MFRFLVISIFLYLSTLTFNVKGVNRDSIYCVVLIDEVLTSSDILDLIDRGADGFILNNFETELPINTPNNRDLFILSGVTPSTSLMKMESFRYINIDTLTVINRLDLGEVSSIYNRCRESNNTLALFEQDSVEVSIMDIWLKTGRVPNFVVSHISCIDSVSKQINRVNKIPRIRCSVDYGGEPLKDVLWDEFPELKTSGAFTFPVIDGEKLMFSPRKPGYQFSPDIVSFNNINIKSDKVFGAIPLPITEKLVESYFFNDSWFNFDKKGWHKEGVKINRTEKGATGKFNGKGDYIDCGEDSRFDFTNSFTLSSWVRMSNLNTIKSIAGKGYNFTLKVMRGEPTFTIMGVKDYHANNNILEIDRWYHLGFSYSSRGTIKIFLDGYLISEHIADSVITPCDYSLIIGSNLWDEYFEGDMAQLNIWNRELSESEMLQVFQGVDLDEGDDSFGYIIIVSIFIMLWALFYRRVKNRKRYRELSLKDVPLYVEEDTITNRVVLLGNFIVIDRSGDDIAYRFSPMLKHLFLVLMFYSHRDKETRGINTARLTSYIWPELTTQEAKNTRGTNIGRLRHLLSGVDGIELLHLDKKWFLKIDKPLDCDYKYICDNLLNRSCADFIKSRDRDAVLNVLKQGRLTPMVKEEWFEHLSERFSSDILDRCESVSELLMQKRYLYVIPILADAMFVFDPLNEMALDIKIRALRGLGKHSIAKSSYDIFSVEYKALYGERFGVSYTEIVSKK